MTDDERAIRELIAAWLAASQRGDTDAVLKLIADEVKFLVPGHPPFGKAEFAEASRGLKDLTMEGVSEIQEIEIAGSWAWARTKLAVTVTPPVGKAVKRSGYTLSIFRKGADGRWQLARDANLMTTEP